MRLSYQGESVEVFTMNHRTGDSWSDIQEVVHLTEKYGGSGVLFFEGNDVVPSPWMAGYHTFASTRTLSPIVAVNPIYMHPFSAAKMVASYAIMFRRKTYLNMITGTALSYLDALDANLSHDDRYLRLSEYSQVIRALFEAKGAPVSHEGPYYRLVNAKLEVQVPEELHPEFFIAGQSEGALRTAQDIGAVHMVMMSPKLAVDLPEGTRGMHFGVLCRETQEEAWAAGELCFSQDSRGQRVQAMSMANTDGEWKKRLFEASKEKHAPSSGYWMEPFRNFKADRPYFVGSYEQAATLVVDMIQKGVRRFILDFPGREEGFKHTAKAFDLARQMLRA